MVGGLKTRLLEGPRSIELEPLGGELFMGGFFRAQVPSCQGKGTMLILLFILSQAGQKELPLPRGSKYLIFADLRNL